MGFFRRDQLKTSIRGTSRQAGCGACGLWKTCKSPRMPVYGEGGQGILAVAESPGETEDRKNEQLTGEVGKFFRDCLKDETGLDIRKDIWKTNAIICHPPKSRIPTDHEIVHCRPNLLKTLEEKQPKIILLLGVIALKSFLGHRWKDRLDGIKRWRGYAIPDRDFNAWVIPTFHPSYVLRSEKQPVIERIFRDDLKLIKQVLKQPFPEYPDENECVEILKTKEAVSAYLAEVIHYQPKALAFDYETTGKRPYAKGHKIACVSMCWQEDRSVVWEWPLTNTALYRKIMENEKIGKVAANMKMEDMWTESRGRCKVKGWLWDTMQAAHVLDNRRGITGLKFQVYRRYGVVDYDSTISSFLKGVNPKEAGANALNRVFEAPRKELLLYCGKDSLFELRLAIDQMKEMGVL